MRYANPGLDPETALTEWNQLSTQADVWTHYPCQLVTPLYGGGVRTGEVDKTLPIRPSGIRGQLRFWWRLACGPFDSPTEMFKRETAIWGGIASTRPTASRVTVRVKSNPIGAAGLVSKHQLANFPDYAVILDPGANPLFLPSGYRFEVALSYSRDLSDAQRIQINEALRWWASFGGVGARTRRGLGALRVQDIGETLAPVSPGEVEAHHGQLVLQKAAKDANEAWTRAVKTLQQFRQGANLGRNPGDGNRPGRSRWPEPDTIRRQTHQHAARHHPEHPVDGVYPRALFGLPIIFHFKDFDEPQDSTLIPADNADRMASPLILRPYWTGRAWHPAALLLPGWERTLATRVGFGNGPYRAAWPEDAVERANLAARIPPMAGRGDDPLTAFMYYFEKG